MISIKRFGKAETDMTKGSIVGHILKFAWPLLIGYLFQQMYNTVDLFVVGHYVNDAAYAAVGSVTPIINTLIGFFLGLSSGAGVLVSQYYGAGDNENVSKTVHTFITLTWIMGIAFTVIGIIISPLLLRLMHMEGDIYNEGKTYLLIYFAGVIGLMIYNTGSGILRAVGDSRRPFYFLVVTAVLNTVLDVVFAKYLHWGVAGVAFATILSQIISAILVLWVLLRAKGSSFQYCWSKSKITKRILFQIIKVGFPAAIQMAITAFSNVFVQSYIVDLGDDVLGGWTTYAKVDAFAMLPMQSVALAATTLVGQNLGAGNLKRAKRGTLTAIILGVISTAMCLLPIMIWAEPLATIFTPNSPDIIARAVTIIRLVSPFYLLCTVNQIYAGVLRGAGATKAPMYIMLTSFVALRQIYLFLIRNVFTGTYTLQFVAFGYPLGWMICSLLCFLYYHFAHWEKYRLTSTDLKTES